MSRMLKWLSPVVALTLVMAFQPARAEDEKKADTGSISVKVNGIDGKPAAGANIRVVAPDMAGSDRKAKEGDKDEKHAKPEANDEGHGKHGDKDKGNPDKPHKMGKAVAEAKTDSDGMAKLDNVPAGEYIVTALVKGVGRGQEHVKVTAGENSKVEITLRALPDKAKEKKPEAKQQ